VIAVTGQPSLMFLYRLTAPRTLVCEAIPDADAPPPAGRIALRSVASAISPGTELAAWSGMPPLRPTARPYPRLIGYCMVAEVTAFGEGAAGCTGAEPLVVGDRVLTHSAHRSHDVVTPAEILARVPTDLDPALASVTYLFHLGYSACLSGGVTAGHRVAVIGLGTLGLTSCAVASLSGARVDGYSNTCSEPAAQTFGVDHLRPKSAPDSAGHDVVILTTNGWDDWRLALTLARKGGRIICLGFPGRGQALPMFNPLASEYLYEKQLTIAACGHVADLEATEIDVRFTLKRNMAYLLDCIRTRRLPAADLVAGRLACSSLAEGYRMLETRRNAAGTLILDWTIRHEAPA